MGIIVDLIIIAVVLLFIFLGYKKGLTGSLIKLLSFIIAIVVAFVLYKPVANAVIEGNQGETFETSAAEEQVAEDTEKSMEEVAEEAVEE